MTTEQAEPRLAVYLDYENLAIGARESLNTPFDFGAVADALAERGRVIARKAYADWSYFDEDRRMLTRHGVELVDIPQRMGGARKNAADIKLAIDAIELALERAYISTFVICTGDSDLTPLVQKLRELDRRVIGVGVRGSTSKLLPPACDEFLFYDSLLSDSADSDGETDAEEGAEIGLVLSTLAGLSSSSGAVRSSALKRAVLRKDPTFSEADLGFRGFGALLSSLEAGGLVTLDGKTDPEVSLSDSAASRRADELLVEVVGAAKEIPLTGLKTALKKQDDNFSERLLGYRNFGSFVRDAEARHVITVAGRGDARVVKLADTGD
ncbi:MAG: NYN domain-containing protein [Acidimicrobiia bacterium]|nr:NYN domain-containing protein [Acidimicrobiia bacterium]